MPYWPKQSDAIQFYGDPRGRNGQASAKWEKENLVLARVPWKIYTSWDKKAMSGIKMHKKCAESLERVLLSIWNYVERSQRNIAHMGLDLCGGGYSYRVMRGGNTLSMHSYGCAVDFDPARNGYGDDSPYLERFPAVIERFEREGWVWGGRWEKKDGMHFQAAVV